MLAALTLLLVQTPVLEVSATVDRERVAVGEQVVFTLKAVGKSTAAFRVDLPAFDGFALVERRERTDVIIAREATRAFTLELELRAEQVGTWEIGAMRVEQGDASAFSVAVTVTVVNASAGSSPGLESDMLALIPQVPSPRYGGPSVFVVTSGEQVYAGDQVNVLTAAWLPRGLRLRLRQPPSLTPPSLPGVWSTPRSSVPGAVASRVLDGETYDLFVGFQTVYPLNPGPLRIPPARLSWMQPGNRASTGEDRRQSVQSAGTSLIVRPLPAAGRPAGFDGPVARALSVAYRLGQSSARAGAVLQVDIMVNGSGNLPLWPSPKVAWPPDARVYEEGTEGSARPMGPRLGGTKRFRLAVVPDSAGSLSLPSIDYAYFDPSGPAYRVAHAPGILVPVLDAAPIGERTTPVPIETGRVLSPAERLVALDPWLLVSVVAAPLLAMLLTGWLRGRSRTSRAPATTADPAERLERLVTVLAGTAGNATPRALVSALRAAGVEREDAERLIAMHASLEAERFGVSGTGRTTPELSRSIGTVLDRIPKSVRRVVGATTILLLLLGGLPGPAPLQAQSGVDLYLRGEYAAAALAFRKESGRMPPAVRLYDLAAAEYMAGRDAHAMAALLTARELAPRSSHLEGLWNTLAREHEPLRRAGTRWPLTAEELLGVALVLFWIAALLFIVAGRRRPLWIATLLLAAAAGLAGVARSRERAVPRAVLVGGSSLRTSPHGLAPERGAVPAFSIVHLTREYGGWWLVETSDGALGWVPSDILAPTPALD